MTINVKTKPRPVIERTTTHAKPFIMLAYVIGMFGALLMLPIGGVVHAIVTWLTITWGMWLFDRAAGYTQRKLWGKAIVNLFFPMALWVLFGVGGVVALLFPSLVSHYGPNLEPLSVLLFSVYGLVGSLAYFLVAHPVVDHQSYQPNMNVSVSLLRLHLLTFTLLIFDWYVRFDQIRSGVYFTWLRNFSAMDSFVRGTNILYHMESGLGNLLIPLCLYLEAKTGRIIFRLLVFAHIFLVFLQGNRLDILLSLFTFVVADSIIRRKMIDYALWGKIFGILFLFLVIIGPPFQVARLKMRLDALALQQNPILIPYQFVTEYLPGSFTIESYLANEQRASVIGRVGSYMAYGASIQQALIDGHGKLAVQQFDQVLLGVVPRFLYPNKPIIDADDFVRMQFRFDPRNTDAAGTPVADVFAYLHLFGILLLAVIVAVVYVLMARWMMVYGMLGELIVLGSARIFLPIGDSFGSYLAILRNALLIALAIRIVLPIVYSRQVKHTLGRDNHV